MSKKSRLFLTTAAYCVLVVATAWMLLLAFRAVFPVVKADDGFPSVVSIAPMAAPELIESHAFLSRSTVHGPARIERVCASPYYTEGRIQGVNIAYQYANHPKDGYRFAVCDVVAPAPIIPVVVVVEHKHHKHDHTHVVVPPVIIIDNGGECPHKCKHHKVDDGSVPVVNSKSNDPDGSDKTPPGPGPDCPPVVSTK